MVGRALIFWSDTCHHRLRAFSQGFCVSAPFGNPIWTAGGGHSGQASAVQSATSYEPLQHQKQCDRTVLRCGQCGTVAVRASCTCSAATTTSPQRVWLVPALAPIPRYERLSISRRMPSRRRQSFVPPILCDMSQAVLDGPPVNCLALHRVAFAKSRLQRELTAC
jgi:hypothetical protein